MKYVPIQTSEDQVIMIPVPENASDDPIKVKDALILEMYAKLNNPHSMIENCDARIT